MWDTEAESQMILHLKGHPTVHILGYRIHSYFVQYLIRSVGSIGSPSSYNTSALFSP